MIRKTNKSGYEKGKWYVSALPYESALNESPPQTTVTEISSENKQEDSASHGLESEDKVDVSKTLEELRQSILE